jgi:hypothetical protein
MSTQDPPQAEPIGRPLAAIWSMRRSRPASGLGWLNRELKESLRLVIEAVDPITRYLDEAC